MSKSFIAVAIQKIKTISYHFIIRRWQRRQQLIRFQERHSMRKIYISSPINNNHFCARTQIHRHRMTKLSLIFACPTQAIQTRPLYINRTFTCRLRKKSGKRNTTKLVFKNRSMKNEKNMKIERETHVIYALKCRLIYNKKEF